MLEHVRGKKLLDGFRGSPIADKDALVEAILRVDRMVHDLEMDMVTGRDVPARIAMPLLAGP